MNTNSGLRNPFDKLYGDIEQLYDVFLGGRQPASRTGDAFIPPLNVWEAEDAYVVETELPGVPPKDVEITLEGRELRIRGERKLSGAENHKHLHRQERAFGQFQRTVRFPTEVNADGVEAKSQDGVLVVTVKKSEALKPRKIQIS